MVIARPHSRWSLNAQRVRLIMQWLELPEAERPHLLTLYVSDVDEAGHEFGPDGPCCPDPWTRYLTSRVWPDRRPHRASAGGAGGHAGPAVGPLENADPSREQDADSREGDRRLHHAEQLRPARQHGCVGR
jgi:hypothetical protein